MTNSEQILVLRGEEYTKIVERETLGNSEVVYFENGYENYPAPVCFFMAVNGSLFTVGGALVTATMLESLKKIYIASITKE